MASAEAARWQAENRSTYAARDNGAAGATGALERAREAGRNAEAQKEEVARLDQRDADERRRKQDAKPLSVQANSLEERLRRKEKACEGVKAAAEKAAAEQAAAEVAATAVELAASHFARQVELE